MNRNPAVLIAIDMIGVDSSQLKAIGYDEPTGTLQVDFSGSPTVVYQYHDVPKAIYDDMHAEHLRKGAGDPKASVGSVFYAQVQKKIAFTRFNRGTGKVEKSWTPEEIKEESQGQQQAA